MTDADIARVVHEVLRGHNAAYGDTSLPPWEAAPDWQREARLPSVAFHRANPDASAAATHEAWLADKRAQGWVFGPVKDADRKTHPSLVPFDDLPDVEKAKDFIVSATVRALST